MLRAALLAVLGGLAVAEDTCGQACTSDAECAGCGGAGRCSSPASSTEYPAIAASCTDAPPVAPSAPRASIQDTAWPLQFTAEARTFTYPDWTSTAAVAKGRYYYDGVGGHTRSEWSPYIDGRAGTQVWIGGTGSAKSTYYVKSGPLCIYFSITDPGAPGSVGIVDPEWIKKCDDAGMLEYTGRELVDGEWADHYTCLVDYAKVNQTIVFQNWNSLGLGTTPKGMPVRVTAGNSAPDSRKGSPRLNTVWYSNFTVGEGAVQPSNFEKPSWFCIPVGEEEAAAFLGVERLSPGHFGHPEHRQRIHYLPHAKPAVPDLVRARRKRPRTEIAGATFAEAMAKLNRILLAEQGLKTKACTAFALEELHALQHELFAARSPLLQGMYKGDRRSLRYGSIGELASAHGQQRAWARARPELGAMLRDGLCHELVMMYIHHLSASARKEVRSGGAFQLPLLPDGGLHQAPAGQDSIATDSHKSYTAQTSCAICHVMAGVANQTSLVI